ncbi:hypothetical protein BC939DRAFT_446333 [Gamsiella multidivaricata]|uniref:uncharacterized protein n=1 Tax=Gamsiella multidivaricata TaxID=101098 RepID=UPI00222093ED|nr:uncharacterized protein BC939DRAFT_446333 [Gamsiella multidivaricata]KAI7826958.1 hypothetical protein BC939DRAFT_446333 [Gamsiella multidivaricata]
MASFFCFASVALLLRVIQGPVGQMLQDCCGHISQHGDAQCDGEILSRTVPGLRPGTPTAPAHGKDVEKLDL